MNDELDLRAAEYVLGSQSAEEREAVHREIDRNPEMRAAVARWEARFYPLARATAPANPPADMLARIKAALPPRAAEAQIIALRRSVRRWRSVAAVAGALAASVIVLAGPKLLRESQKPEVYVAAVNRGGDAPALIVRVDLASGRVFVRPVAAEAPAGKSLELWYIGQGARPRSMGLVGAAAENLPLPSGATLEKAKFAVTVEPAGGSPTGDPTGPIVYAGDLIRE
jgi:anti-sigma-K factor RskA